MQGYGPRTRLPLVALVCLGVSVLTSCSLLSTDASPSKIMIPGTNAPSTESPAPSLSPTSASRTVGIRRTEAPWSYERVIKAAPRASNSGFQVGATSADGRTSDVSGFHFSTPDRGVRCSTGNNGADALVCVGEHVRGAKRAADATAECDWQADYVVLDANGPKAGACANSYPVLFRSRILGSGRAINVDRFACLTDSDDLYCVESSSGTGFAITANGYSAIRADERAPASLLGLDSDADSPTVDNRNSSPVVPTR
ncbi:hypothetical protein UG54_09525 [Gordonia sihwensis]|nr:hypothetical protein UG54_09525 [Gordonia sihwensis]